MKNNQKTVWGLLGILIILFIVLINNWISLLHVAHSSFESYFVFRGCIELVEKTDTYGICKNAQNQSIEIVKSNGKWYLAGDLPGQSF